MAIDSVCARQLRVFSTEIFRTGFISPEEALRVEACVYKAC